MLEINWLRMGVMIVVCLVIAIVWGNNQLARRFADDLVLALTKAHLGKLPRGQYSDQYVYTKHMTREQLFYMFNVMIKYFTVIPAVFIFLVTTNPSELAASMNRVGVPYTISYALSIALRYIPDVQGDFHRIRNAQEARGIEMSAKARLGERIRRTASIIFPLLFSSMERIEVVSNAMELRSFGKNKKRTWYAMKPLGRNDRLVLIGTVLFFIAGIVITYADGSRFWAYWL